MRRQQAMILAATVFMILNVGAAEPADKETLFVAKPLTEENSFTEGIEGPNCDAQGNVYAVNFKRQGTIGRVPNGRQDSVACTCRRTSPFSTSPFWSKVYMKRSRP